MDTATARNSTRKPTRHFAVFAAGIASVALIVWLLVGMPGLPLDDGSYVCGNYTATVAGGEVTAIDTKDPGTPGPTTWEGANRSGDHRFTVSAEWADGSTVQLECLAL